ncbi:MAG TPA: fimbria/pilus outer membrane usher protein [Candidatus Solibacter sp.]|nr:fimbria/pilus outer membrane usher protein [Candidatus Solibacter sp.]
MKPLISRVSGMALAAVCLAATTGVCFGQMVLASNAALRPGVLYCTNESGPLLCSDDTGVTWHDPSEFQGRYKKAWLLAQGRAKSSTVPVTTEVKPAEPQKKPVSPQPPLGPHEVVLAVQINGRQASDFARLVQMEDGKVYAPADLIAQWRLRAPTGRTVTVGGQTFYSLDGLSGVKWQINHTDQTLALNVPSSAFTQTVLNASYQDTPEAARPNPGLFLNHQLVFSHLDRNSTLAGLFEAGFFSKLGVVTSRFAERDFTTAIAPIRLDTKLVREFPHQMAVLTIGDSISAINPWSRQVTYGGVRWASDFTTQPNFIPIVLPNLAGQAAQPSTVDIFVNGVRTSRQQVDPGPFAIHNVPVITGQGDVQMVVTDILGRQQVITQSYISARELLRPGVNEYAYEAGSLRRNFGTTNAQYGAAFFEGTHRHGFTDRFTLDGRLETSGRQQTGGVGVEYGVFPFGIIGGGVAGSHSDLGPGALGYMVVQRRARHLGYSGTLQIASSTFQQLGMIANERAPRLQAQFQVSEALGSRSSFSVGYLRQENRAFLNGVQPLRPDFSGISSAFSVRVGSRMYLTAAANLSHSFKDASSATVSLIVPLGGRSIASATGNFQQNGSNSGTMEYTQQAPVGSGYGYRVRTDYTDHSRVDAGFTYQTDNGTLELESSDDRSRINSRLTETGGLVMMQGHVVPSRWLNNSFAIVQVPDTPGVKVFANNQYIAKTSWRGLAVLPVLAPYNKNTVRLDDQGVPINLGIDFDERTVVPMSRSGVFLKFKATQITGALFQLVTEKGEPVPLGAEVTAGGSSTIYTVALRGEVFLPEVTFPVRLIVHWADQQCEAAVEGANTSEPLPKIGPVPCKVKR